MTIEQHTSLENALTFAPPMFFMNIGMTKEISRGLENLEYILARVHHYQRMAANLLDKPRAGWCKPERGIPPEIRETVSAHIVKVSLAGIKIARGLRIWHMRNTIPPTPAYAALFEDYDSIERIAQKGFFHDFQEWGDHPDLVPGQVTKSEQDRIEYEAMLEYAKVYGDSFPLELYESMRERNLENEIVFNLDKMDAAVMALNYERLGYNVDEFFPYTLAKLTLPMMREILETLIEHKREYPDIDFFIQYDSLLANGCSLSLWRREMDARLEHGPAWELHLRMQRIEARGG